MDSMLTLMKRFRAAYAKADRSELLAATTDDFEWHQHYGRDESDAPSGRVLQGIDALLDELTWRRSHWSNVRYDNLEERAASDLLVQTFTISGEEDGKRFAAKAVDLYPVRDGRISRKDTYWKYLK